MSSNFGHVLVCWNVHSIYGRHLDFVCILLAGQGLILPPDTSLCKHFFAPQSTLCPCMHLQFDFVKDYLSNRSAQIDLDLAHTNQILHLHYPYLERRVSASLTMENGNGHIYKHVQDHYSNASRGDDHIYGQKVAQEFGYSAEELGNTPEESNLGLSCGNPVALANLKEVRKPVLICPVLFTLEQ